jgi:hypothetical protein
LTSQPKMLPFVPEPLQARMIRREPDDGDVVRGFFLTWRASEGRYCGRCPLAQCTRDEVPDSDVSTCVRLLRGEASARFAAALGLEP